jgi:uncharacterized membrane protein YphA (DoxX/SURF4 family)
MKPMKIKGVVLWGVQILFAALYLVAASGKLMSRPQVVGRFRNWGFPDKFYLIIGTLELLGAIGLLIPWTAGYAAAGLFILMIGAALTHLINGEGLQVLRPLIFMVFLGLIVYLRRPWASKS